MSLSISKFFDIKLNAPLKNIRWSWGAEHNDQDIIVLRVWGKELRNFELDGEQVKGYYVGGASLYAGHKFFEDDTRAGTNERRRHVEAIEQGSLCVMVVCQAKDYSADKWEIERYNDKSVFIGSKLVTNELGQKFVVVDKRLDLHNFRKLATNK